MTTPTCNDKSACNTGDAGDCTYPVAGTCDCMGKVFDCADVCGGNIENKGECDLGTQKSFNNPKNYFILSSYPNPFNAQLQFSLECNYCSTTQIEIVDLNGQVIEEIYTNLQIPSRFHSFSWNAQNYNSGIYFAHILTSTNTHI